jgi:hypothetical protein
MTVTNKSNNRAPRLGCEQLEARENPAGGNVTAFVSGGQLFVIGDALDNAVTVRQDEFGNVIIAGVFGTTVNGQQVVNLGAFVPSDVFMSGGFGNDQLDVAGLVVANELRVSGGSGNDLVQLRGTNSAFLTVATHDGNDLIIGQDVVARVGAQFNGGSGSDTAMLRNFFAGQFFTHVNIEQFV